jgi:putative membrane protein
MQVVRTVVWIVITAILVAFVAMNWERAPVNFWPLETSYLHFDWPVGVIALFFFVLGWLPMYLLHRAARWRFGRRIASLESNLRTTSAAPPALPSTRPESETAAVHAAEYRAEHNES